MRKMWKMPKMQTWIVQGLILAGLLVAPPVAASAGGIYRWTTKDGTVAFTDDPKRIPPRYRHEAVEQPARSLASYRHYTPEETAKSGAETQTYLKRLDARIAQLEAINESAAPAAQREAQAATSRTRTLYQLAGRTAISVPTSGGATSGSDEPLVVQQERVRDPHGIATRHVTVIRQGNRIISVVEGESTESGAQWPRFQQLTGDQ